MSDQPLGAAFLLEVGVASDIATCYWGCVGKSIDGLLDDLHEEAVLGRLEQSLVRT